MVTAPTLLELQRGFANAVLDRGSDFAQWVVSAGLAPAARLQVYGNAIASTQIETLRATYPAVRALVGEDFFEATAMRYRLHHPSTRGNLQAFGGAFAAFLATMPEAAAFAYLPDVAHLEWLRQQSALAAEASPLAPATLDDTPPLPWQLHPSVRLLASAHPVLTIWRYATAPEDERLQLDGRGEQVVLWRDGGEVAMTVLDAASFACIAALIDTRDLEAAHAAARAIDGAFDLAVCLRSLLEHQLIAAG
ncbi:putative DNA-binding domain-containing protein [Rhodanobacter sp. B2A1Ga4]|uniref:HvfC/BufC N-terminal domain-containing protein n=1 Tax=Rhodanobacter sp. B2A1Ga4 TaxID=2778647 RepID=UPI001B370CED|nr:DNA-binding domain-containing protein [Rhodanobacter sp. B2A1Ga4]MBQ4855798.1 putative DNA-binding domain-containing protein [Rhodanobacter sp. B2A1Ga4]